MNTTVDGEFQKFSVSTGAYVREHFFGPDPRLRRIVEHLSDDDIAQAPPRRPRLPQGLRRVQGGDRVPRRADGDPRQDGQGLDPRPRRRGAQHHPPGEEAQRGRAAGLPRPARAADPRREAQGRAVLPPGPGLRGGPLHAGARAALGGPLPRRVVRAQPLPAARARGRRRVRRRAARPPCRRRWSSPACCATSSATRSIGKRIVPIIPDEARTFGMDPLFKEVGIYAALGQRYEPVDSDLVLSYREATDGQVLEEGINEAGSMASFQAAGTSYATHGEPMIPFYIFYSMFGFQRTGDQAWAFGDQRGRGFMIGATAGPDDARRRGPAARRRPHPRPRVDDPGHPRLRPGLRLRAGGDRPRRHPRMYGDGEDVFYYVTVYNENYAQPREARRRRRGHRPRPVPLRRGARPRRRARAAVRLVGSGSILQQVHRRARPARRASSGSLPRSTRRRRSSSCATRRCRPSAGTASTPTRRRACRT